MNFFRRFSVTCKVATGVFTGPITLAIESKIGEIEDEIIFHELVALKVMKRFDDFGEEFHLGELVEIGLDFEKLNENFDFVINKCWAFSGSKTSIIFQTFNISRIQISKFSVF